MININFSSPWIIYTGIVLFSVGVMVLLKWIVLYVRKPREVKKLDDLVKVIIYSIAVFCSVFLVKYMAFDVFYAAELKGKVVLKYAFSRSVVLEPNSFKEEEIIFNQFEQVEIDLGDRKLLSSGTSEVKYQKIRDFLILQKE